MHPAGEYDPKSLLVDQIEEAVSYTVERLFLHYETYQFISFFTDTLILVGEPVPSLHDSNCQELPAPSHVCNQFETSLVPHYSSKMTPDNFLDAVKYIKKTVFQHLGLYQFLLTQEQSKDVTTVHLPIEVLPSEFTPLAQGIEEEQWKKREKMEQLKAEHAQKEKEMSDSHTKAKIEVEEKLKEAYEMELAKIEGGGGSKLMTPEEVSEVIGTLLTAHMEVLTSTVTHALQRQALAIEARLEKMEIISAKASKLSISSTASPPKLGPPSPSGKKSRTSSRLSVTTNKN